MSRRCLNISLEKPKHVLPEIGNPMDLVKPKPVVVQTFIPNEPVFLTRDQWDAICYKTHDVATPFKIEVTVIENKEEDDDGTEEVKEEEIYVPKKTRKSKK